MLSQAPARYDVAQPSLSLCTFAWALPNGRPMLGPTSCNVQLPRSYSCKRAGSRFSTPKTWVLMHFQTIMHGEVFAYKTQVEISDLSCHKDGLGHTRTYRVSNCARELVHFAWHTDTSAQTSRRPTTQVLLLGKPLSSKAQSQYYRLCTNHEFNFSPWEGAHLGPGSVC